MDKIWLWSDRVTIIICLIGTYYSIRSWIKSSELLTWNRLYAAKRKAPITIRLLTADHANKQLDIPYKPRRDQLSRAELAGILSFYFGSNRFDPAMLRFVMENGDLGRVLAGDLDSDVDEILTIPCTSEFLKTIEKNIVQKNEARTDRSDDPFTMGLLVYSIPQRKRDQ